jgi:Fe2+ or Zn2+ uptake regulation protein
VYSEKQRAIVKQLREATGAVTAKEIADELKISKRHVQRTLKRLAEQDLIQAFDGGPNGALLYAESGLPHAGVVNLGSGDTITTASVRDFYTWAVAIRDVTTDATTSDAPFTTDATPDEGGIYQWIGSSDEG